MRPYVLNFFLLVVCLTASADAAEELSLDRLIVQAEIPRATDRIAFGFDSIWGMAGQHLLRINTKDNSIVAITVKGATNDIRGIAVGEGAVWVPAVATDTIFKIDPSTNSVVGKIAADMSGHYGSIGVGEGAVWVLTLMGSSKMTGPNIVLTRYNAGSGAKEADISLPSSGLAVLVDYGSVWVSDTLGWVYRIDPKTNSRSANIHVGPWPSFLASGAGAIWAVDRATGMVYRIDAKTTVVTAVTATGVTPWPNDVDFGGGYVWVSGASTPVAQINAETGELVRRFIGFDLGDRIRYGGGSLWLSGAASIWRIDPPK